MSRFSKAEAERRGWAFVSDVKEVVTDLGDGLQRVKAASLRAEKYVDGSRINEEAESIGKLLERIHAYEAHRDGLPDMAAPPLPPDPELPKVKFDGTVPRSANPLVPVESGVVSSTTPEPAPVVAPEEDPADPSVEV